MPFIPRRAFVLGSTTAITFATPAVGEAQWIAVRRQFPFSESRIPMNAANLCPSPRAVAERVTELTRDIDRDCSFQNRARFEKLLEEARAGVARHLGASADEIALVRNTSEANNTVNSGLALKAGDEVVVWDQNHPTNNVAWDVRAARYGFAVRRVTTSARLGGLDSLVTAFENEFTPRTRVLAITHVSNVTGLRLPVRELCEAAHRRGIFVHVDGAQTWGALQVNVRDLGCDTYSASAHKWLCGPKEAGVLYVKGERIAEIWPHSVAPGWGEDVNADVRGARKFESLGQRDDACLAAVGTAVAFHDAIGPAQVEARVLDLATRMKDHVAELGARLVTPRERALSAGVCVIAVPPARRNEAFERLYRDFGISGAPTGGLRLCPHVYNTLEHLERAFEGLKALRPVLADPGRVC